LRKQQLLERNVNLVIVDACRAESGTDITLPERLTVESTLVAFACQTGRYAYDGCPNSNGLYTGAFLEALDSYPQVSASKVRGPVIA
jgi:uncharacterized caspase-like protein